MKLDRNWFVMRRTTLGFGLVGIVALCPLLMGGRMFDPNKFAGNHLFVALVDVTYVSRAGILTVDVTDVFAKVISGMTFPAIIEEMRQLGTVWPLPVPAPGTDSGISFDYDVLKKIPGNHFRAYDSIVVFINIATTGRIKVTKATWVNTAAYP
ncbi:MAG: hypothetical protein WBQ75_12150 [Acetobacteraceae bacterium]